MDKRLASVGMAAAIGLGGLAVAAVSPLGIAGAQQEGSAEAPAAERSGPLQRALDALVADGTLTQEQADAVASSTKAEAGRAERKERREARRAELLGAVSEVLGATPDEVQAARRGGASLAAQAEAAGVDRAALEDAVRSVLQGRLDAAVADGRLSEERAVKVAERLDGLVDRIVDADGQGGGGGRGHLRERLQDRFGN